MQRLTEHEHHVVGDVDREADRAHPRLAQASGQPGRAGRGGVDAAHRAGHEPVRTGPAADGGVVRDADWVSHARAGGGQQAQGRVGERRPGAVGVLAGDPAHAQAVTAVGGDVDLDGPFGQAEQLQSVLAGDEPRDVHAEAVQDDDPLVVLAQAELLRRADHAVGDVAVRSARGDDEPAGQHRTGQRHDDQVARAEVVRPADDAARLGGPVGAVRADVDRAPVDGLAVLLRLRVGGEDTTHHDGTRDVAAVDPLLLQPDPDQVRGDLLGGRACGDVHQLGQPRHRYAHQAIPPS